MAPKKCHKKLMVMFGTLSGWITSLLVLKIGKAFAFLIGSVIVFMEFTNDDDFLKFDWEKINERFAGTPDNFKELNNIWSGVVETCGMQKKPKPSEGSETKFSTFLLSFIGGVLLAIGSH